jgi:hypothetical protein
MTQEGWGLLGETGQSGAREHQIAVVTIGERGQSEVFPRSCPF